MALCTAATHTSTRKKASPQQDPYMCMWACMRGLPLVFTTAFARVCCRFGRFGASTRSFAITQARLLPGRCVRVGGGDLHALFFCSCACLPWSRGARWVRLPSPSPISCYPFSLDTTGARGFRHLHLVAALRASSRCAGVTHEYIRSRMCSSALKKTKGEVNA